MSAHNVNLCVVLSDTRRIIKANRGHFLALSLLFVLPLSFSSIVYPSLSKPRTSIISSYSRFLSSSSAPVPKDESPPVDKSIFMFPVIYYLFELLFSFFTTASITSSISNGFFGEPLKLTSSLKSILVSFLPLTATYIVSRLILVLTLFAIGGLAGLVYGGIVLSGAETAAGGDLYLPGIAVLITVLLAGVMIYFLLEWYLADVVVVVESKWGYAPLRRSSYLVKGMKWVAFSILICFSLLFGITSAIFSSSVHSPINGGSVSWMFVLQTVAFAGIKTILKLYSVAATAVLFIYCKGLRGESATEIVDEIAPLFVRLPYDGDEKAPKIVVIS